MNRLHELVEALQYDILSGTLEKEITRIVYDSRRLEEGCLFVCMKGANANGHDYFEEACKKKAAAIVVSEAVELPKGTDVTVLRVEDTRYALAFISAAYFDHPARALKTIGITGTKGKTTTTYLVKSILEKDGYKTGLIGTIKTIIGDVEIPADNTTPESYILQETFRKMVDAGMDSVVMEVSSQGLMMHRTQGFVFDYGIFTNLQPDHIGPNEHESFEEYRACKGLLFKQCKVGIVNADDAHFPEILKGHTCTVLTYGIEDEQTGRYVNLDTGRSKVDYRASRVVLQRDSGHIGVSFTIHTRNEKDMQITLPTPGRFSVYNALTAIAVCEQFGVDTATVQDALFHIAVKGRIELVKVSDDFTLMIDYAHNAMALKSLLGTLREYRPKRLVCLFGCGGNRSRIRRFEMGEVSGELADFTIITSDNPRFEQSGAIMDDIETGILRTGGRYIKIEDRKEAIRYAILNGQPGDIIVLAGKGHEDYQEIRGVKYPMDERVLIAEILKEESYPCFQ